MKWIKQKIQSRVFLLQNDGKLGSVRPKSDSDGMEFTMANQSFDSFISGHRYLKATIQSKRLTWGVAIIALILLIFVGRSAQLQIVQGEHYQALSERNRFRTERLVPPRGLVKDRSGFILAKNIPSFVLTMTMIDLPKDEKVKENTFAKIISLSGLQRADIDLLMTEYSKNPYDAIPIKKNIPYETAIRLAIETADLPGFDLQTTSQRAYTSTALSLSHVLGYTGKMSYNDLQMLDNQDYRPIDEIGKVGIERSAESILRGKPGKLVIEVDAIGNNLSVISKTEPIKGGDITLAIDYQFQKFIEKHLQQTMEFSGATRGSVVAINPQTGAVRALVSLPSYNNNLFTEGIDQESYARLIENPDNPLFSRAISGEFPSGSIFKPFVAYAALAEGVVNEHTSFLSTGGIRIGQWIFPDWKGGGHGITDVRKAISESVNTYFYIISGGFDNVTGLGVDRIARYARLFGFGEPTGIDLPSEADGFLPSKTWKEETKGERWYVGDTYHLGIGQGDFLTTPLQMAVATSVIANGGKLFSPYLIETVDGGTRFPDLNRVPAPIEELDEYAMTVVRQGMRQTVTTGSARSLSDLPMAVAGKTGTAQTPGNKPYHSWFSGFMPYEDPNLTLVVLVEEGGESNDAAVPLAKQILWWWSMYGG